MDKLERFIFANDTGVHGSSAKRETQTKKSKFKLAILLYFWNTRRLRNLVGVRSRYTLSERYQLQENIRAFRVTFSTSIIVKIECHINVRP